MFFCAETNNADKPIETLRKFGWLVGVAPVDGDCDAREIPPWPIRIRPGERCYSPALEIDVPDDATLRCLTRAAGGEG